MTNATSLFLSSLLALTFVATPAFAQDDTEPAPVEAEAPDDATPTGAPAASMEAREKTIEDTDYAIRLRGLEERVNDLKERIFRSKARLILLRETVLNGVISGAKAQIVHRNEMGSSFTLEQVRDRKSVV